MQRVRPKIAINNDSAAASTGIIPIPFWLTNSVYFIITTIASITVFLTVWTILTDETERSDAAWFPALLAAVVVLAIAAALHRLLLRQVKNRFLLKREQMAFPVAKRTKSDLGKFTLEKHSAILNRLQSKSEIADAPNALPEKHLEAYRACGDYLEQVDREIPTIRAGSPRLAAFRSGQERVRVLQKHHLLHWAGDESRKLLQEAQVRVTVNEKVETAQRALEVLEAALQIYPNEVQLVESTFAVQEFIAASYVAYWIEMAERAAFKENYEQAIDHYRDALFYLSRESVNENQRRATGAQIEAQIARLLQLSKETRRIR